MTGDRCFFGTREMENGKRDGKAINRLNDFPIQRFNKSIQQFNFSTIQQKNPFLDTSPLRRATRSDSRPNPKSAIDSTIKRFNGFTTTTDDRCFFGKREMDNGKRDDKVINRLNDFPIQRFNKSIKQFNFSTIQQKNPLLDTSRLRRATRSDSRLNPNAQIPNPKKAKRLI